jgi:DNA repair exonuclease SbcCD ATPase subunit
MGRVKKYAEVALNAAAGMLPTAKSQAIKIQLVKSVLQYEQHREERADARRAERLRRNENKELAQLRAKLKELTAQSGAIASAKDKEIEELKSRLNEADENAENLQSALRSLERTQSEEVQKFSEIQNTLSVTKDVLRELASAIPEEKRIGCAANLFGKFKSTNHAALDHAFTSIGLRLSKWVRWDKEYGTNGDHMLDLVLAKQKPEGELYALLRLKLLEIKLDYVDAIDAVRQYRDREITFLELDRRVRPHMVWSRDGPSWSLIWNHIPPHRMPSLTNAHLGDAMRQISDPELKWEWLNVVSEMLKPQGETASLLLMELQALSRKRRSETKSG